MIFEEGIAEIKLRNHGFCFTDENIENELLAGPMMKDCDTFQKMNVEQQFKP